MWTREGLKNYAKDFLRKHYWKAFLVCLIFTLLAGNRNNNSNNNGINIEFNYPPAVEDQYEWEQWDNNFRYEGFSGGARQFIRFFGLYPLMFLGSSLFAFVLLLWVIISMIIGPLITVGKNRFFLEGFKEDVDIKYLFSTFNREEAWGIFKCMFITNIKNFFWYLLFIVPGIIKSYEYSQVPYLLTKDPNLTSAEAIEISRQLTDGHKLDMFVLDLSFIGWYLLGSLLLGIGSFFVNPYPEATKARLHNVLSGNDGDHPRLML